MDWVGNSRFGVTLPYNYWTETQWHTSWTELGLRPEQMINRLCLYPVPADWFFGAQLHFIALLENFMLLNDFTSGWRMTVVGCLVALATCLFHVLQRRRG